MKRLLPLLFLVACSQGTEELYARERALPMSCRVPVSVEWARAKAGEVLPTVPVHVYAKPTEKHLARRDRVTGIYTITLAEDAITSMAVAHELAHVIVQDAYRPKGPFDEEEYVAVHGDVFVKAYKLMLARLVSQECSEAL